jgi:ribosomal protein S12 methylthiotransferase
MTQVRIHTISLGCPKNQVDTEWMLGGFGSPSSTRRRPRGGRGADQHLRLHRARGQRILAGHPGHGQTLADLTPGPASWSRVAWYRATARTCAANCRKWTFFWRSPARGSWGSVCGTCGGGKPAGRVWNRPLPRFRPARLLTTPPSFAYLKIAEGCDNRCRFCTIPSIRGPLVSRDEAQILDDARRCLDQGRKELVLIAQDVTAYGRDLGRKRPCAACLKSCALCAALNGCGSCTCIRPASTSDLLFPAELGRPFVPYFDIPLQHAHPDILASMGRLSGATPGPWWSRCANFSPRRPCARPSSSAIPARPRSVSLALESFVREARFMHLGVFPYYPEDGSEAATLPDQLPDEVKEERRDRIMELQAEISEELLAGVRGQELDVLVDRPHEEWPGCTRAGSGSRLRRWTESPMSAGKMWGRE